MTSGVLNFFKFPGVYCPERSRELNILFSQRLEYDLRPNRLASLLADKIRGGVEIIDLTLSTPTRAGFEYPYQEMAEAFSGKIGLDYAPDPKGLPEARVAVSEYYLQRGEKVSPEDILITSSTSEAYSFIFRLLADPGERIVIPVPGYPLFEYLLRLEGLQPEYFQTRFSQGWWNDFSREVFDRPVKGLVVVNPGNPAGNYVHEDEWISLAGPGQGIPLVCDEVFHDFPLDDRVPAADIFRETERLEFILNGFSKTAGMPQLKMSWIVLRGPEALKQAAKQKLELISDTYLSVSTAVQAASPEIFRLAPLVRRQIRQRVRGNLARLEESVKDSPVDLLRPEGGWSAVVRMPRVMEGEEWAEMLLEHHGVLAHPGEFYSMPEGSYLVLSLLPEEKAFREGVSRFMDAVISREPGS